MKERIRMRIRGSRRSWIYIRISLFLSLMFLYCLDPVLLGSGIMFLIAVWYYQNVMQGNNRIYPYVYASDWFKRWLFIVQEEEAVLPMR